MRVSGLAHGGHTRCPQSPIVNAATRVGPVPAGLLGNDEGELNRIKTSAATTVNRCCPSRAALAIALRSLSRGHNHTYRTERVPGRVTVRQAHGRRLGQPLRLDWRRCLARTPTTWSPGLTRPNGLAIQITPWKGDTLVRAVRDTLPGKIEVKGVMFTGPATPAKSPRAGWKTLNDIESTCSGTMTRCCR